MNSWMMGMMERCPCASSSSCAPASAPRLLHLLPRSVFSLCRTPQKLPRKSASKHSLKSFGLFSGAPTLNGRSRFSKLVMQATDQSGQIKEEEVIDNKILPYCSVDKKAEKRTIGELEQEFLEALQSFYFENKPIMSNEEFDNLKQELMWEGSSVVMLSPDEQKFTEASLAYAAGKPIMTDTEYDELKLRLKKEGSKVAIEGPRCSIRSRKVYSDLTVDYFKMFLLNVPASIVALTLVFFLDDITGFEITYLLELPEPYSFVFTWFVVLPAVYFIAQSITSAILKDFLILKGPCPNCGTQNTSFFGTILTVPSGGPINEVKCENCGIMMAFNSETRLITLIENQQESSEDSKPKKSPKTVSAS